MKQINRNQFLLGIHFLAIVGIFFSFYYAFKFCMEDDWINMLICCGIFSGFKLSCRIITKEYNLDKNTD